jgi:hypothetical protein
MGNPLCYGCTFKEGVDRMWRLIVILIIVLIVSTFWSSQFREGLLTFAVIVGLGILLLIADAEKTEEASKLRITVAQVELSDLELVPNYYGTHYRLIGRIKNTQNKWGQTRIIFVTPFIRAASYATFGLSFPTV